MYTNKQKSAKQFDFMQIFNEARAVAKSRNEVNNLEAAAQSSTVVLSSGEIDQEQSDEMESSKLDSASKDDETQDEKSIPEEEEATEIDQDGQSKLKGSNIAAGADLDDRDPYFLPVSQHLSLEHGNKPLTAIAVDPAGARVATGGFDFELKLWDFGGMDSSCRPFKVTQPCEEHQIKNLEFSPSGETILVVSGSAQAFIVNRDGDPVSYTNKGYQYITDPASAKGHTHALTCGCWHPLDSNKFLTGSLDCTLRLFHIDDSETVVFDTKIPSHKICIKPRNAQGRKTAPTACAISKDAHLIAAGCQDGSLQLWDLRRPLVNTAQLNRKAHPTGTDVTSLAWTWDGRQLASRAMDDTVRLWDARALNRQPLHTLRDLPVTNDRTELTFSPNDKVLAVAVSAPRSDPQAGKVVFYRRDNMKPIETLQPNKGSVIRCQWHQRLNQLFYTFSTGSAQVDYNPDASINGALMCSSRQTSFASRRRARGVGASSDAYMKPVLLTYNEETIRSARKSKILMNTFPEMESQIAVAALTSHSYQERVANDESSSRGKAKVLKPPGKEEPFGQQRVGSLHQYMVQQIVLQKNDAEERAEKDIRGAILRHAKDATEKPFWTKAYLKTQPNPVFHDPDQEVKEDSTPVWKKQKLA